MRTTKGTRRVLPAVLGVVLFGAACAAPAQPVAPPSPAAPSPAPRAAAPSTPAAPAATPAPRAAPTPIPVVTGPTPTPARVGETPRQGGLLTSWLRANPPMLDLLQQATIFTLQPAAPMYSTLLQLNPDKMPDYEIIPDLAESWSVSGDGTVWEFKLHAATFHDGTPVTSADVAFTLNRMAKPPTGIRSPSQFLVEPIQRVETPDPRTVRLVLKRATAAFAQLLVSYNAAILPKHILEKDQHALERAGTGTGPFKFKNWIRGVSVEIQRYDRYFLKGLPYLDGIKWFIIPESATQIAALRTGQVLFTGVGSRGLFGSDVRVLRKDMPELRIIPHGSTNWYELAFNLTRKPFDDLRVRQAIMMALNQQQYIDLASDGEGFKGGHMHPDGPWSLPAEELNKFPPVRGATPADIAQAKRLLAEAGYPNGLTTNFLVREGVVYENQGTVMINQLRALNITGAVRTTDHPAGYLDVTSRGDFSIVVAVPIPSFTDPDAYLKNYLKGDPGNIFRYSNPDVDKLFAAQAREMDTAKRQQLVRDLQRKLWQDLPSVPLYHIQYFHASWPQVRGWKGPGMTRESIKMERVWLAK